MLAIIYGCVPITTVSEIGGINNLINHSYLGIDLLKVKYIGSFPEKNVLIFSALVTQESGDFENAPIPISHILISPRKNRSIFLKKNPKHMSDNARRKALRRENNPTLTFKNWKQFTSRKSKILRHYETIL